MKTRTETARQAAKGLRDFADKIDSTHVMLGFDGFVDSIISVVDKRESVEAYTALPTIQSFGERVIDAAGKSANFELVTTLRKLGGNGPIMANAMSRAGLAVTYVGAVGYPTIDPVFREMAERAELHPITDPGTTDALEFDDGKLMIGKYEVLNKMGVQTLKNAVSEDKFLEIVRRSSLVCLANWTMCAKVEEIWQYMLEEVYAKCDGTVAGCRRKIFIDLADPAKRPEEDLLGALKLCKRLNEVADVTLGLNLNESLQVSKVLGVDVRGDGNDSVEARAVAVREAAGLYGVVIHPREGAGGAVLGGDGQLQSGWFDGPFVQEPKLSTGAGDNFNAGYCLGLLAGLSLDACLCCGTATSGFYVRNAKSPTLMDLSNFCDHLPEPA